MIIIDSRESSKNKAITEGLKKLGVSVSINTLPVGDYYINGKYIVERKTAFDVAHSIRDRRIFNELLKMAMLEDVDKWLLIEGSLALIEKFTNFKPESITGLLVSAAESFNVKLFFTPSRKWTVIFLYRLDKRSESPKKEIYPVRPVERHLTPQEIQRSVLEGFPMLGPQKAHLLLKHFKTLRRIFTCTVDELLEVPGIGQKTAEEVYKIINIPYELEEQ